MNLWFSRKYFLPFLPIRLMTSPSSAGTGAFWVLPSLALLLSFLFYLCLSFMYFIMILLFYFVCGDWCFFLELLFFFSERCFRIKINLNLNHLFAHTDVSLWQMFELRSCVCLSVSVSVRPGFYFCPFQNFIPLFPV